MVTEALEKIFAQEGVGLIEPLAGARFLMGELCAAPGQAVEVVAMAATETGGNGAPASRDSQDGAVVAFEREVSVQSMPCLKSHVLNRRAVLPVSLVIEWLAHGAMHGNPGLSFLGFDGLRIYKGVVCEPDAGLNLAVSAHPAHRRGDRTWAVRVELASRSHGRRVLHARADVVLGEERPVGPVGWRIPEWPALDREFGAVYTPERLFHGVDFHGIEQVEALAETRAVAWARSAPVPGRWIGQPLRRAWLADPLVLDSAFQLMILWTLEHLHQHSLPCAITKYRQFRDFPKNGARIVVVVTSSHAHSATADIHFVDGDGRLVACLEGYECVTESSLKDAFRLNTLALES